MTSSVLLGLLIAAAIVLYWMLCRKRSLAAQGRAVELLCELYADESISDSDKSTAHANYLLVQRWWYVPFLVVVMPFFLLFSLVFHRKGLPNPGAGPSKHQAAMDSLVMIYLTRNPITATLSFTAIVLMAVPVILIAVLLNRLNSLPSFDAVAEASALVGKFMLRPSKRVRAH